MLWQCSKCREMKSPESFYKGEGRCKKCKAKYMKELHADGRYHDKQRAWRAANPEKHAANVKKHGGWTTTRQVYWEKRNRLLVEAFVEDIDRQVVWGRDEGHCRIKLVCNGDFVPFAKMELDHIIPVVAGGAHAYYNVQTGCLPCNRAKGARLLSIGG